MYKVLIVDDEAWVVESFKKGINWCESGFEVVGYAYDGREALAKIEELKPDLVLTDIRMPVMGGLELIKKAKEKYSNTEFIIISGYAEFAYVQKALNYGAAAYCLKPFDDSEMEGNLKRVKGILDRHLKGQNTTFPEAFFDDNIEGNYKIEKIIEEMELTWDGEKGMRVLICSVKLGQDLLKYPGIRSLVIGFGKRIFILTEPDYQSIIIGFAKEHNSAEPCSAASGIVYKKAELQSAVQQALTTSCQYFIKIRGGISEYSYMNPKEVKDLLKKLEKSIEKKDMYSVDKLFDLLAGMFNNEGLSIKHAFIIYNTINYFLSKYGDNDEESLIHYEELLELFKNVHEMIDFLRLRIGGIVRADEEHGTDNTGSETIKKVLQYINSNFCQDITLNGLALRFYLNPNYLCRVFKKETGKSFTDYISQLRIGYARELLKSMDSNIYEIAEKCGYKDYFYFAKLFKRMVKKTPTEYRLEYYQK